MTVEVEVKPAWNLHTGEGGLRPWLELSWCVLTQYAYKCHPRTQETGGSGVLGHLWLHIEFDASQGYISSCLRKIKGRGIISWFSRLRVFATKPDDMSSIPRTHTVEGEN